jgi:hypothetical protein
MSKHARSLALRRDVGLMQDEALMEYQQRILAAGGTGLPLGNLAPPPPHGEACDCSPGHFALKADDLDAEEEDDDLPAEDEEASWYPEIVALGALLLAAYEAAFKEKKIKDLLVEASKGTSRDRLEEALTKSGIKLSGVSNADTMADAKKPMKKAFNKAVKETDESGASVATLKKAGALMTSKLADQVAYYMDNYFSRIVHPSITAAIERDGNALEGAGSMRELVEKLFDEGAFDSSAYWKMVASNTISKTHHYGVLKAAQAQRMRVYTYNTSGSGRVCPVCSELEGKQWWVADAIALMEAAADAPPEMAKKIMPWPKLADVKGKSARELSSINVICPPLHPRCSCYLTVRRSFTNATGEE